MRLWRRRRCRPIGGEEGIGWWSRWVRLQALFWAIRRGVRACEILIFCWREWCRGPRFWCLRCFRWILAELSLWWIFEPSSLFAPKPPFSICILTRSNSCRIAKWHRKWAAGSPWGASRGCRRRTGAWEVLWWQQGAGRRARGAFGSRSRWRWWCRQSGIVILTDWWITVSYVWSQWESQQFVTQLFIDGSWCSWRARSSQAIPRWTDWRLL